MEVKKGSTIKVVKNETNDTRYSIGDEFEVAIVTNEGDVYIDMNGESPLWLVSDEYEVIEKTCPRCFGAKVRHNGYHSYPCICAFEIY